MTTLLVYDPPMCCSQEEGCGATNAEAGTYHAVVAELPVTKCC